MGRWEEAREAHDLSLRGWREANDVWGMATAHMGQGVLTGTQGSLVEARAHLNKSARLYQQINDRRQAAKVLNNLAMLAEQTGDYLQASKGYRQSLFLLRKMGDRQGESVCLNNMGRVQARSGDFARASNSLTDGIRIMHEIGYTTGILLAVASLAEVARMREDHRHSVLLYGAFDALSQQHEVVLPHQQQFEIAENLAQSRCILGPQIYGIFWKRGQRMTLEAVLKSLLGQMPIR